MSDTYKLRLIFTKTKFPFKYS